MISKSVGCEDELNGMETGLRCHPFPIGVANS